MKLAHEEISLLNKGLQYSIEKPIGKYWTNLIMETELAIRKLDIKMQAPYRILAPGNRIKSKPHAATIIQKRNDNPTY
jgi:hypothetical protein